MSAQRPDDLVILTHAASEFEARAKVIVLAEQGIEAAVFPAEASWLGTAALQQQRQGVPIWVRADDLDRAAMALDRQIADSVDLDWETVEVGEPDAEVAPASQPSYLGRLLIALPFILVGLLGLLLLFR